jgi:hypothetical protein
VANGDSKEGERGGSEENNDESIASGTEGEEGSQRSTPGFETASTAARKRKAEDSVNDKLAAMAATIEQPMAAQKEMAGSQKAFLESIKAILDRNKELVETIRTQGETIKTQGEEIEASKASMQKSPAHISYSEVTANSGTSVGLQRSQTRSTTVFADLDAGFSAWDRNPADDSAGCSILGVELQNVV